MKGSYILLLDLAEDSRLTVGRLGTFEFPAGIYFYCGSALNGLEARIRRHLRRDKKRHRHIDHLTAVAQVVEVWWVLDEARWECRLAEVIGSKGGKTVAKGFGSSDCRCPTHLLWKERGTEAAHLLRKLPAFSSERDWGRWRAGDNENSPSFNPGEFTQSV